MAGSLVLSEKRGEQGRSRDRASHRGDQGISKGIPAAPNSADPAAEQHANKTDGNPSRRENAGCVGIAQTISAVKKAWTPGRDSAKAP